MVICLERGADLHMAQLIPLPLTVSCFSKIQIGFTFLVPAHPGSPGQRAVKRVCVCVCRYYIAAVASSPALGPWAPPAERGPSLESIYRVSLTVDLCEDNKIICFYKFISPQPVGGR